MIKLRTFNLEKIDMIKHYGLLMKLNRDEAIQEYISHNFVRFVDKYQAEDEKIAPNKAYVVKKAKQNIGVVGTLNLSSVGKLEIWYAIDKDLRGEGYGEKVLAEITPYLIENVSDLEDIELKIKKKNLASKRIAENNGYILDDGNNDTDIYHYFGNSKK